MNHISSLFHKNKNRYLSRVCPKKTRFPNLLGAGNSESIASRILRSSRLAQIDNLKRRMQFPSLRPRSFDRAVILFVGTVQTIASVIRLLGYFFICGTCGIIMNLRLSMTPDVGDLPWASSLYVSTRSMPPSSRCQC